MNNKHYPIEKFIPDLKTCPFIFLEELEDFSEENLHNIKDLLNEAEQNKTDNTDNNDDEDIISLMMNYEGTAELLNLPKEDLIKFVDLYYTAAVDIYKYFEYEYCRFGGGRNYLYKLNYFSLYLCAKYFESVGETDNAKKAYFILLCIIASYGGYETEIFDYLENTFSIVEEFIEADWLALHPQLTHNIGMFYLEKGKYDEAKKYFEMGAELDYDGRQSIEPFIEVGKNEYELGLLYYKGLGVEQDYEKALELFEKAADDAGEPSIPIIGDMYYNGLGVEKDYDEAINFYGSYNRYNLDLNVYYKDLNNSQEQILTEYIERRLKEEDVSYDEIIYFSNVYEDKLNNYEESKRLEKTALEIAKNTPIAERTEQMDNQYARYALSELEKTLEKPTQNTGNIPKSLKPGDIFTFGCFNKEPIEWKVLERDSDGAFYVVSTKILFKSDYNSLPKWLNSTFLNYSFTEEEKKHVKPHVFENFLEFDDTYIYVPERNQLVKFEGDYEEGSIKQTAFAESQSKNNEVMCFDATSILPNGQKGRLISENTIRGIRPAMDVFIDEIK